MKKIIYISLIIIAGIFLTIMAVKIAFNSLSVFVPTTKDFNRNYAQKIYYLEMNGIVQKKFLDNENFHKQTLQIKQFYGDAIELTFATELSGFYSVIELNDSIYKEKGSFTVYIYRNNMDTSINLKYKSISVDEN